MDVPKMNGVSADINLTFRQTMMNLKALNGQTDTKKDDDIVILDDHPTPKSHTPLLPPSYCPPQINADCGQQITTNSNTNGNEIGLPLYEPPKSSKFEINDRVRNNFKDIMSKIQENTPSLGNLLSKTKNMDTRESMEERERKEREKAAAVEKDCTSNSYVGLSTSSGNLFENLKVLQSDKEVVTTETEKHEAPVLVNEEDKSAPNVEDSEMDVILLDDSVEENTADKGDQDPSKQDCDNCDNKVQSPETKDNQTICLDNEDDIPDKAESVNDEEEKMEEDDLLKSDSDDVSEIKEETKTTENEDTMTTKEQEDKLLASDDEEEKESEHSSEEEEPELNKKEKKVELKEEIKSEEDESQGSDSSSSSNSSSSSGDKIETDIKDKIEVKEEDNDQTGGNSENCDRKRPAESSDSSVEPKRSRLDMVIGKLGSQIGIKPELLKEEPEEDMSDTEEPDSEMTESKSEDTTTSVTEDEEDSPKPKHKFQHKKKRIRVTPKELENLVRSKVQSYLQLHQSEEMKDIQKKLEEVQSTCELWKTRYKELEKKVLEVTVLQQTHEKRKAKTAALRQISTKNVGVQVDENKANAMSQLSQGQNTPNKGTPKTPPKSNPVLIPVSNPSFTKSPISQVKSPVGASSTPLLINPRTSVSVVAAVPPKLTPMTITQVSQSQLPSSASRLVPTLTPAPISTANSNAVKMFPQNITVKSLLDSSRNPTQTTVAQPGKVIPQPPVSGLIPVIITTSQNIVGLGKPILSKPSTSLAVSASPIVTAQSAQQTGKTEKVIDLTGEEDSNSKRLPLQAVTAGGQQISVPVMQTGIGTVPAGGIQMMRPTLPASQAQHSGILLSTPAGTQIVRNPQQQAFQLVFNSSSPAIRPGQLVTVMSGPGNNLNLRPVVTPQAAPTTAVTQSLQIRQSLPTSNAPRQIVPSVPSQVPVKVTRQPPPLQAAPSPVVSQKVPNAVKDVEPLLHPAPLPLQPKDQLKPGQKPLPPRPTLKISRVSQGIVLSWNMTLNQTPHADISSYHLFAYQEGASPPSTSLWKKVGDVKALPLPMACTLTQFQEGNRYHFSVRAVDVHNRVGSFSEPSTIHLTSKKD